MKKSLIFAGAAMALVVAVLCLFFSLVSNHYFLYLGSPDLRYDLVSLEYDEEVVTCTGAYDLLDKTCFVFGPVNVGTTDVTVTFEDHVTGEIGAMYVCKGIGVNRFGMLYRESLGTDFHYWQVILIGIGLYFLLMGIWFCQGFIPRFRETIYDYNTVFHCALMLMCFLFAFLFSAAGFLLLTRFAEQTASDAFALMGVFVMGVVACTLPFVLVFSILVSISNLALIRHEGLRPVNLLGIAIGSCMSVLIVVCVAATAKLFSLLSGSVLYRIVNSVAAMAILFLEMLFLSTALCAVVSLKRKPPYHQDYIIILGCKIRRDGTLYPLIRGRVDCAMQFYREQEQQTGKRAVLIPSGGKGTDEQISEAQAMANYMRQNGIPDTQILPETESTTTLENMRFSKRLIDARGGSDHILFATTNYHAFRSGMLAMQVGLKARGIGSRTKWYFWPNAFLREFLGMLAARRKTELLLGVAMTVIVILLANIQTVLNVIS